MKSSSGNLRTLAWLSTALAFSFVIYNLNDSFANTWNFSLWVDEVLTLRTIFSSPLKIIESLYNQGPKGYSGDYFPPVYYLLVHFIHKFGLHEFGIRLFNNICVVLTFFLISKEMNDIDENTTILCFMMFCSVSVYFVDLIRLIRPYTLYFCLQTCSLVFIIKGISKRDAEGVAIAGAFNVISLYTNYAAIGNVMAEIGCFSIFYLIDKHNKKFHLTALFILLTSAALFLPWLPGYVNVIRSAAASFGAPDINMGRLWHLANTIYLTFSGNNAIFMAYTIFSLVGICLTEKKIVTVILSWGILPGLLIAINGHTLATRHIVTLNISLLLLSSFALARLAKILDKIIFKITPRYSLIGLALGFFLAISTRGMTIQARERLYGGDVSPYLRYASAVAMDFPNTDLIFSRGYDTYKSTIFRWYLEDMINVDFSSNNQSDKKILVVDADTEMPFQGTRLLKTLPGYAGNPGYIFSGLILKNNSPLTFDNAKVFDSFKYIFSNYRVLEDAFSWKNVVVDTRNATMEPANRLEDGEIVFKFHLLKGAQRNLSVVLQGLAEIGMKDTFEILASSDNVDYLPLHKTVTNDAMGQAFTLTCNFESSAVPELFYIKLQFKPGMVVPCAVWKSLTFKFFEGLPSCGSPLDDVSPGNVISVSSPPSGVTTLPPDMADFGNVDPANAKHVVVGPVETVQVITPYFGENFNLERDLFLKDNLRIKRNEGCLTCNSDGPCQFTYFLNSPKRMRLAKIIFYPRIFNDQNKANYVKLAYSYNGKDYNYVWSAQNDGSLNFFGQRVEILLPLNGDVRNLFLRFELYSEGSQVFSFENHAMYIITDYCSIDDKNDFEVQTGYLKTVKRLFGL